MSSSAIRKSFMAAAAIGALGLASSFTALAGPADDAIKARQGCMKAHGAEMKVMVPMMKGEAPYDKAAVDAVLAASATACADWAKSWGADTQKGETLETWAKPEIWTDAAGFEAAGGAWYQANEVLKASADEAGFKAAFAEYGKTCQGCHDKFRRPKE